MQNTILSLIIIIILGACTPVKPWQRGTLAKEEMSWSYDPLQDALKTHITFSKEGSSGGGGSAGGGCGCN